MKALNSLALSLSRTLVTAGLVVFCATGLASTTSQIATIGSATTDGTASGSTFQLSVTSGQLANALTTSSNIELSLTLAPQGSHQGLKASIYTVIVAGGKFFKLAEDGAYGPWNGTVEDLTPFATNQTLNGTNRFTLLDGKMAEAGSYLYFVAYSVEGETRLLFTPDPAQITVTESSVLPDDTTSVAAETFEAELESAVVQAKCILCHVEGGLARNSSLQFQRTNTASALNNFASLSAYVDEKGAELLLSKITGGDGHAGGPQLSQDSEGYEAFERVIAAINELDNPTYYAFSGSSEGPSARQASFLTEVMLEPRESTLRRATLLLQGRLPTEQESKAVVSDAALRVALRNLMQGPAFREFVVTSVNDRLLTEGTQSALNTAYSHFLKLHNLKASESINDTGSTVEGEIQDDLRRTSGELVAYVIENELPYSEILTADYMMMNRTMNTWLEGTATFSPDEGDDIFKPSVLQGYYYNSALEEVEFRENSNSTYRAIGEPLQDFPHAGLLTDFGFLSRYPTTATNRNRARARWTFYHFLGIDIEKSSQRPTDEASLSDRNNPTMNNPNCTVCHALLDPVAGAFQNWDDENFYRGSGNGYDALDGFYKYPPDGSRSPYRQGDLWYRDMREPGLFDSKIKERHATLRSLGELIVEEPLFKTASAAFWWSPVFGKPLLDKPTVEADNGYAAKLAAYRAQQEAIEGFAEVLSSGLNAKDMLVEMFMSPWFSGETVTSYAFDSAHFEAKFGGEQLLTPQQLARKTRALTGVAWRTSPSPSGRDFSDYEQLSVLLGGIDSEAVTARAIELTPTMTSILMTHATESACLAVARQFASPAAERSLLSLIEESTQPQVDAFSRQTLPSKNEKDWQTLTIEAELTPGLREVSLTFSNPQCDWDGSQCIEQRVLWISSVTVISPSGQRLAYQGNDSRLYPPNNWQNGKNQNCYTGGDGLGHCYGGEITFEYNARETGKYRLEAVLAGRLMPSKPDFLELAFAVKTSGTLLSLNTPNAQLIKKQISELYEKLHGTRRALDSDEVIQVYEIFAAALTAEQESDGSDWEFENCSTWKDGYFDWDLLSKEEVESYKSVPPGANWYQDDRNIKGQLLREFTQDPIGTKYAWTAVMMYMLSHYDYLHE
jgi:hypothetical protein